LKYQKKKEQKRLKKLEKEANKKDKYGRPIKKVTTKK